MSRTQVSSPETVALRPLTEADETSFLSFATQIAQGEWRFLKEDLADAAEAFRIFRNDRSRRVVAVDAAGDIVGLSGAYPGDGWSSHVAELRVLVAEHARSRGLGRALARAALVEALQLGCTQAYVEVVAEQDSLVAMFQDMGFLPEALLADFVRDSGGEFHDLMILTHKASEHWSRTQLLTDGEVEA